MKRTLAAWTIGLTVVTSAYSGAAAAAHIDITNMGDMGGYPFVLGADGVPSSSMGARRASAAAVEGVVVVCVGGVWDRVLKGGRASQFWASRWGVAEGKEMVSARVGLEVRRLAAGGEAGVRKEWVRWSRMWPSR